MSKPLTFISLFAGIGGFDLGLERAGMKCIAQVEIDPYCRAVLAKHWPDVPRFEDVREVGAHNLPAADLICGGFPCQDISNAGKRAGINGERSGLWAEFHRIICELRPRYVIVENVAALLVRGIDRVLGDLAASGLDAEWFLLPASAIGAKHFRCRLFVVGFAKSISHTSRFGLDGQHQNETRIRRFDSPKTVEWTTEPDVCRVANGLPVDVDALRGLGNAVVPQVAEVIGRAIVEAHITATREASA